MTRFLILILAALLLSACGPRGVPMGELLPTPASATSPAWKLNFSLTGGIAGFDRTLQVDSSGLATVTDVRTNKTAEVQLNAEQLSQLQQLAAKAVFQPAAQPGVCADCFVYTLEIDSGTGTPFTAQVDDTNLEASGLAPLIDFLRSVMDNALK